MTLYSLGRDWIALEDLIDELDGDVSDPKAAEAWETFAREIEQNQAAKLDGYATWCRYLEMAADRAREEAALFTARAKTFENKLAWAKGNMKAYMDLKGLKKVYTESQRCISIVGNGGTAPLVKDDSIDPSAVPDQFVVTRRTIDWTAVRDALEAGDTSITFAKIGERGTRLQIK